MKWHIPVTVSVIDTTSHIAIITVQHTRWACAGVPVAENTLNLRIFSFRLRIIVGYVHVVKHQYVLNQDGSKIS